MAKILSVEELKNKVGETVYLQLLYGESINEITMEAFDDKSITLKREIGSDAIHMQTCLKAPISLYYLEWRCWDSMPNPIERYKTFAKPEPAAPKKECSKSLSENFEERLRGYLEKLIGVVGLFDDVPDEDCDEFEEEQNEEPEKPETPHEETKPEDTEDKEPEELPFTDMGEDTTETTTGVPYSKFIESKIISKEDFDTLPIGHSFKLQFLKKNSPIYDIKEMSGYKYQEYWKYDKKDIITAYKVGQHRSNDGELYDVLVVDADSKNKAILEMRCYGEEWLPWRLSATKAMIYEHETDMLLADSNPD